MWSCVPFDKEYFTRRRRDATIAKERVISVTRVCNGSSYPSFAVLLHSGNDGINVMLKEREQKGVKETLPGTSGYVQNGRHGHKVFTHL